MRSYVEESKRWTRERRGDVKELIFENRGLGEGWVFFVVWEFEILVVGSVDEVC